MSSKYSYQKADLQPNEIAAALRNPNNFESILVCTVIFIVVGIFMTVTGGVICLVYYTEITPPNFDSNYHRYVGSSLPRLIGPLLVAFGMLLIVGDFIMIGAAIWQSSRMRNKYSANQRIALKTTASS